jgi:hypothetical protein
MRIKNQLGYLKGPLKGVYKKKQNMKNKALHLEPFAKSTCPEESD